MQDDTSGHAQPNTVMELHGRDQPTLHGTRTNGVVVAANDVKLGTYRCHADVSSRRGGLALCLRFDLRPSQPRDVESEEVPEYGWPRRCQWWGWRQRQWRVWGKGLERTR